MTKHLQPGGEKKKKKQRLQNDLFTRGDPRVSSTGCAVAYSAVLVGSGDVGPSVRGSTLLLLQDSWMDCYDMW